MLGRILRGCCVQKDFEGLPCVESCIGKGSEVLY